MHTEMHTDVPSQVKENRYICVSSKSAYWMFHEGVYRGKKVPLRILQNGTLLDMPWWDSQWMIFHVRTLNVNTH